MVVCEKITYCIANLSSTPRKGGFFFYYKPSPLVNGFPLN